MAAIGPGWATNAWIEAGWIPEAWAAMIALGLADFIVSIRRRRRMQ